MSIEQTELKWFKSIRNDRDLIDDSQVFAMSEPFRRVELNKLLEFFRTYSKDSKTLRSAYKLSLDRLSTIYPKNQIRAEINNSTGFKSSVTSYEEDLINDFSKRKLFETSYEVLSLEEEPDSNVLMDKFKTTIDLIQDNTVANDQMTKADAVNLIHEKWARLYTGDYSDYLRTGIQDLDDTIIGFQKKTLIVPCARPSFGKTALALTIMENMVYAGHKCAFISVEMTKDQLMERLAFIKSEIPSDVFFEGTVTDTDRHEIATALNSIQTNDRYIIECVENRDISNVTRAIRKIKRDNPNLDAVFVDYIQKIDNKNGFNKTEQIADTTGKLTDLSKKLDVAMIALAQLNRESESDKGTIPSLKHLEGSSAIEKDADKVIIIHRSKFGELEANQKGSTSAKVFSDDEGEQTIEDLHCALYVAKNRSGKTGLSKSVYNARCTKFKSYDASASWKRTSYAN